MKMIEPVKKWLSVILCFALCFAMIPAMASAEAETAAVEAAETNEVPAEEAVAELTSAPETPLDESSEESIESTEEAPFDMFVGEPVEETVVTNDAVYGITRTGTWTNGESGDTGSWRLNFDDGILHIAGTGEMPDYSSASDAPWYICQSSVTAVEIADSVTRIGLNAFSGYTNLKKVTMPDSVKSMGDSVFEECRSLTDVTLSNSLTYIPIAAFYNCAELENITVPTSVMEIGKWAFTNCPCLTANDKCGSSVKYWLFGSTQLFILGSGEMADYYPYTDAPWNAHQEDIKRVIVGNGVTNVGAQAFSFCANLTGVILADSVETIKENAFYGCTGLTEVKLSAGLTEIKSNAFNGCSALNSLTIPESVTSLAIDNTAFEGCPCCIGNGTCGAYGSDVNWIAVRGSQDFLSITGKGVMTYQSSPSGYNAPWYNLQINGKAFIGSGVTTVQPLMLTKSCSLTYIQVADTNPNYTSIDGVLFSKDGKKLFCYPNLRDSAYTVPDGVETIESYAFYKAVAQNVTIPAGVTSIGNDSFDKSRLESIELPDGLTEIGNCAFLECSSLKHITVPDSVITIGYAAFDGCVLLESIVLPPGINEIGVSTFKGCRALTAVDIPDSVAEIHWDAFSQCSGLQSVTLGKCLTEIGKEAFAGCSALQSLDIPDSVTNIEADAFENSLCCLGEGTCGDVKWHVINGSGLLITGTGAMADPSGTPTLSGDLVVGSAPWDETGICERAFIGSNVTYVSPAMFVNTETYLERIDVSEANNVYTSLNGVLYSKDETELICYPVNGLWNYAPMSGVTRIGDWAFAGAYGLQYVKIPDSVTDIGKNAFFGCSNLESVSVPSGVTDIGEAAFAGCSNLKSVDISASLTGIADSTFARCSRLQSIVIPSSVTGIGESAFAQCTFLTEITIPSTVTGIGNSVFAGCSRLRKVIFTGSAPFSADTANVFQGDYLTVYYPENDSTWVPYVGNAYGGKSVKWVTRSNTLPGDVNADGVINLLDLLVLKHALADENFSGLDLTGADVNVDGNVTLEDLLKLKVNLAG